MSFLSDITNGWLGRQFGLDDAAQQARLAPPDDSGYLGGRPNFGLLSPQFVPFDQYNQDRHSFSGIMGALTGGRPGLGAALGQAFAPDSFSVPGYNAQLGQVQGLETNRLNLAPWEDPQGTGQAAFAGPQPMKSPASLFNAGSAVPGQVAQAPVGFGFGGQAATTSQPTAALPGQQIAQGPTGEAPLDQPAAPPSNPAPSGTAPNLLDAKTIAARIAFLSRSPAGMALAKPYVDMLNDLNKQGTGFDAAGNQIALPGAYDTRTGLALANKGISTGGVIPGSQASVNAAVARQAGATRGAETTATNLADLRLKPAIAKATAEAELPSKITAARAPFIEPKIDQQVLDGLNLDANGNPRVLATGTPSEIVERGKKLADLSDTIDKEGAAAQEIQGRAQFILREMPKAMTGSFADRKAEVGRLLIGFGVSPKTVEDNLGNVASADVLQKEFYRLSTDQVKGLGREPGYILDKIASANPNLETQPEAMTLMAHAVDQGAQRRLDKQTARDAWLTDPTHMKSLAGFEAAFNKSNPQDLYVNRAYQRTDEMPDGSKLIGTKNGNRVWQLPNGSKVMARHN